MRFAKGHGTENDFVIVLDPDGDRELTPELAARLCDRRAGLGADGVLRAVRLAAAAGARADDTGDDSGPEPAEWFMDYRNADGSVAEMCGNGIRVFARYLAEHNLVKRADFTVATRGGARRVWVGDDGNVTVDMGAVTVLGPGRAVVGGEAFDGLRITVGNPHLACLTDRPLAELELAGPPRLDPAQFPEGANVELVKAAGPGTVAMRVHERGSGETRSCGTGAVAAAVAAARAEGRAEGTWRVLVPGGRLDVVLADGAGLLTGPAVIVAEGELDPAWLAGATAS